MARKRTREQRHSEDVRQPWLCGYRRKKGRIERPFQSDAITGISCGKTPEGRCSALQCRRLW